MLTPSSSTLARFWAKVVKTPGDGCWTWTAAADTWGYGVFRLGGRCDGQEGAHRFSYRMSFGEIPDGLSVCHRCDNPPCVRPDHLFLGTAKDNARDAISKGRRRALTPEQITQIRSAYGSGETQSSIAARLGVSQASVSRACHVAEDRAAKEVA